MRGCRGFGCRARRQECSRRFRGRCAEARRRGPVDLWQSQEAASQHQDFAGLGAQEAIANLRLGTLFLAAGGLNHTTWFCASYHEALVKRVLIEVAELVVLLADSTKFTASAMVRVFGLDALDRAVMDDGVRRHRPRVQLIIAPTAVQPPRSAEVS